MLSLIVAVSDNGIIGDENKLPWTLPRDLKRFAELTIGHTVLMGRKTFDSILARRGSPLPNRKNVIMTKQKDFFAPVGCFVVHSWDEAMSATQGEHVFVIGGAEIYRLALPFVDQANVTRVHLQADGDVRFPQVDFAEWNLQETEFWGKDEKNPFDATFQIYERRK